MSISVSYSPGASLAPSKVLRIFVILMDITNYSFGVRTAIFDDILESIISLSGVLGRYVGDQRFYNEVGPEEMHNFQPAHHEDHEYVGELQNFELVLAESLLNFDQRSIGRDDADSDKEVYSAKNPCGQSIGVEAVEHPFCHFFVILSISWSTL